MHNFSESCQRNQAPIYDVLKPYFERVGDVLEIGSGSGQHAHFFTARSPQLNWQCSDRAMWLPGLEANIAEHFPAGFSPALELDVNAHWPDARYDMIYTANSLHIMSWENVQNFFANLASHLRSGAYVCCYGPFKYSGEFTSPSNANFQHWLQQRDPLSGIRDFEALDELATAQGLTLCDDIAMPANNQMLIWQLAN